MGQLLNRLSNFAKSYVSKDNLKYAEHYINSEDEELKKIIDGLNNKNEFHNKKRESNQSERVNNPKLKLEYKVLGLNSNNATIEEIKKAYKTKVKEFHPDTLKIKNENNLKIAQEKTLEINSAYSVIKKERGF
jgi:DnaJ-domain-containing protein 1